MKPAFLDAAALTSITTEKGVTISVDQTYELNGIANKFSSKKGVVKAIDASGKEAVVIMQLIDAERTIRVLPSFLIPVEEEKHQFPVTAHTVVHDTLKQCAPHTKSGTRTVKPTNVNLENYTPSARSGSRGFFSEGQMRLYKAALETLRR